jgi:hypothetical protein
MSRARRLSPTALVAVGFLILALALLYPGVLTGKAIGDDAAALGIWPMTELGHKPPAEHNPYLYDATFVFHPDMEWARSRVRGLTPPIWNPYNTNGFPQLASQQTAVLFPLTYLAYLLPFWWSLGLIIALKIAIAGLGTFLFARSLGQSRWPAAFSAVAFAFGVFLISWLSHPHSNIYVLMPWMLLAADAVLQRRRVRDMGLLALAWGLAMLGGQPESVWICGLLNVAYIVWRLVSLPGRRRALALSAGGIALGVAAGAVVLLPFFEGLHASYATARGASAGLSLKTIGLLLAPEVWGRPDRVFNAVQPSNYLERTVYVGVIPLLLAAAATLRWRKGPVRFFAVAGVVAALFVWNVPGITHVLLRAPVFDQVAMTRAAIDVTFCLAILAGFGLQGVLDGDRRTMRVALVLCAGAAVLPFAWVLVRGPLRGELGNLGDIMPLVGGTPATGNQAKVAVVARLLLFAVAGGLLVLAAWRRPRVAGAVAVVAVALAAFDLVNLSRGFYPAFDASLLDGVPSTVQYAREHVGGGRIVAAEQTFIPNLPQRYGLRDVRGQGLPQVRRVGLLFAGLGGQGGHAKRVFYTPGYPKLLGTFGVNLLLGSPPAPAPGISGIQAGLPVFNVRTLPRAFVASSWRTAGSEEQARTMAISSTLGQLGREPIIEDTPAPQGARNAAPVPAQFTEDHDLDVRMRVDAPNGGWLVLLDTYYPGWNASVDGQPAEIHAANSAFRAVKLPPGARTVEFTYRPASVIVGAIVSALAWLAIIALIVRPPRGTRSITRA